MWIEETKNGKYKYCERYEDYITGKMKKCSITLDKKTAATKKQAAAILVTMIEQRQNRPPEVKELKLSELVELYLKYQKKHLKASAFNTRKNNCATILRLLGPDALINRITADYITDQLEKTGKKSVTLNNYQTNIKTLLRWGYKKQYLHDASFLDRLEPFKEKPRKEKIQDKYLEPEELTMLIDSLPEKRYQLVTRFLALSGLRFGEMAALTKKDVDFKNNEIHITKDFYRGVGTQDTPKTFSSQRDVYMQSDLRELCREIILFTKIDGMGYGYRTNLFICSAKGSNMDIGAYNAYLKRHTPEKIEKKITSHVMRHTHVSLLAAEGVDLDTIGRRLGHENDKTTKEVYLHVTKKLKERDNAQIEKCKIL